MNAWDLKKKKHLFLTNQFIPGDLYHFQPQLPQRLHCINYFIGKLYLHIYVFTVVFLCQIMAESDTVSTV